MEVVNALRMKEGNGETSYARNSCVQLNALLVTKHIKDEAIRKMYLTIGRTTKSIAIADLGCSSSPDAMCFLIKAFDGIHHPFSSPNFSIYLNDLPGNDFNTLFKSVLGLKEWVEQQHMKESGCFIYGVPGSFYGRLFESQSLHFAHSSFAVNWLSQIPKGIASDNSKHIYISRASSGSVSKAYHHQFQCDFWTFLTSRSEEMVNGGQMVLSLIGRSNEEPSTQECWYIYEMLAIALNQMVSKGLIDEEKMDSFNLPVYLPSLKEIEDIVKNEGCFTIDCSEISDIGWAPMMFPSDTSPGQISNSEKHTDIVRCMRAVMEPILAHHFGESIIEEVFKGYNAIVADHMAKERSFITVITVSLCRKVRAN